LLAWCPDLPTKSLTETEPTVVPPHFVVDSGYDAPEEGSMGILVWLIVGGVCGWLASIIMRTDAQQGILLNVIVGIVGALLAGFIISPMVGVGTINEGISLATFLVSLLGAVVLLAIVNLFRRGSVR
jgi:uncharacterized membrane protein YeaQ/YmgE (transglycosylase-associated protein family)